MLQSVAVLAGVTPVALRPAAPAVDEARDGSAAGATRPGARVADQLQLSPVALDGADDRRGENESSRSGRETGQETGGERDRGGDRGPAGAGADQRPPANGPSAPPPAAAPADDDAPGRLSESEEKRVAELRARDTEVRTHEQAHKAVGGRYAGSISYEYTQGPDGRRYATGGSVPIDASPVPGDPEATVSKMRIIRAAALAPAEPSPQDRKVAAQADRTAARAQQEIARERAEAPDEADADATPPATGGDDRPAPRPTSETPDREPAAGPNDPSDDTTTVIDDPPRAPDEGSSAPRFPTAVRGEDPDVGSTPESADAVSVDAAAVAAGMSALDANAPIVRREAAGAYQAAGLAGRTPRLDLMA